MSKKTKKQKATKPRTKAKPQKPTGGELSEDELERVAGGIDYSLKLDGANLDLSGRAAIRAISSETLLSPITTYRAIG